MNEFVRTNIILKLTVNKDADGVLLDVGGRHHHAGEGSLVSERGLSNQQAVVVVDANPLGITVCRLDCDHIATDTFHQQVSRIFVVSFLKHETTQDRQDKKYWLFWKSVHHIPQPMLRLVEKEPGMFNDR